MPVTQDRLSRLREFGLSEYAARSYLALLDLGIAEARDVSSLSKVPQAKIYHVLEQLHDKGLVVILPEFPKKYAPVPFEEYLGRLYEEYNKAAKGIEEQRKELAEMFRVMGDTEVGDRGFFTVIRGRRNVLAKIEEIIAQTQKDLIILGTAGTASRASHMLSELRRAREREVRVRILSPMDAASLDLLAPVAELSDLRARELDEAEQSAKVAIVVSDSARAFLIHFVPDDANLYAGKDIGVFTDQEAMVAAIQAIVEPHWVRATTYARMSEEIREGRTHEFTRIYGSLEEAQEKIRESIAAGAGDICAIKGLAIAPEERPTKARWRAIFDLRDEDAVASIASACKTGGLEVRHLRTPMLAQQLVIDDREAFFSLAGERDDAEVIIHTNAPPVVRALRTHFESLWTLTSSIEERRRELEIFPDLQPGDVGIGRLFHLLRDAVVVADSESRIVLWNPAAVTTFGESAADVRGRPLASLIAPNSRTSFSDRLARFQQKNAGARDTDFFEVEGAKPDGARVALEVTLSPLQTVEGAGFVVAVMRDVTARKQARESENEAHQRILRAYDRMTEGFYALDSDFRFVYRNPVVRSMQKTRSDVEIDGQVIWDAFPELAGTKFETELKRAMAERQRVKFEEHYAPFDMWFEVTAYPSDEGLSVYFRNVTDAKRAEDALKASAQLLEATLDATPDGILVISTDGKITGHNRAFREMWSISDEVLASGEDDRAIAYVSSQLVDGETFRSKVKEVYARPESESRDILHFKDGRVFERTSKPQRIGDRIVGRVWCFRDVTRTASKEATTASARSR